MKFLEDRELSQLNSFLAHVNLGDHVVTGQLENYSCAFVVVCDDALRFFIHLRRPERERESFFFRVERTQRTSLFSVVFFFVVVLLLFRRTDRYRQSSNVR